MYQNSFLTPHFTLSEMCKSETAEKHGIVNVPSELEVENLKRLCEGCLEPLREAIGLPIIITSGYRCKHLNEILLHSARKSQHMLGCAADFHIKGSNRRELLIKAFREILTNPKIGFDQLILYPSFIHVSYVSKEKNRRGILLARGDGKLGYGRITLANALKIS